MGTKINVIFSFYLIGQIKNFNTYLGIHPRGDVGSVAKDVAVCGVDEILWTLGVSVETNLGIGTTVGADAVVDRGGRRGHCHRSFHRCGNAHLPIID